MIVEKLDTLKNSVAGFDLKVKKKRRLGLDLFSFRAFGHFARRVLIGISLLQKRGSGLKIPPTEELNYPEGRAGTLIPNLIDNSS